ncbi:unnamed protein product [Nippostrongylus brasiliensis]|uniref:C2H2-type domain-containing protein n=1 Tax=Nippostrongylus brasiliensis TaxID=27835 RepID=A0A158R316_NIPBR|nr:unnamed protein product [Nippostrongylus brasiliensis]
MLTDGLLLVIRIYPGIGSLIPDDGVLSNNQNTRYYGCIAEERANNYIPPNRIKSNTSVPYTQTIRHVPESRLQNYNFEVNGEKWSDNERQLCPSLKFRCQYPNCRRVVSGNVSFVCHLWAHVVSWKEYDPKSPSFPMFSDTGAPALASCKRNDVDILSTCPSCTARFHTPYLMQVHYTRCHSRQPQAVNRATCAICERDVRSEQVGASKALRSHLMDHEPNDAPYHCKRCRYRCTVRLHLFDHFAKEHKNTSTLMCPFCTFTLVVPSYQRKRPVIRASEFVAHMISHECESRLGCDNCALSFSSAAEKQKHRREHIAVNPKWAFKYRDPETRSRQKSRLVCQEQKPLYQCSKCANSSESSSHQKKCLSCVTLAYNESLYGKRRTATDVSVRRGIDTLQCSLRGMRFACKCGMKTRNGNRMAQHFYYCNKDFEAGFLKLVIETDDELAEPTEADEIEDKAEAELFAVPHKIEPAVKTVETNVEKKRKFVEPPLLIFEGQVNNLSTPADLSQAVVFFRKCADNDPQSSIKGFRDLREAYDSC